MGIKEKKERVCITLPVSTNRKLSELAKARHTTRSAIVATLVEGDFEAEGGGLALGKLEQLRLEILEALYAGLALEALLLPDHFRDKAYNGWFLCDLNNSEMADFAKDIGARMAGNGGNLGLALAAAVEDLPANAPHKLDYSFAGCEDEDDFIERCRAEGQRFEDWRSASKKE